MKNKDLEQGELFSLMQNLALPLGAEGESIPDKARLSTVLPVLPKKLWTGELVIPMLL